jgi:peptide/nickel transport system permease protein
MTIAILNRDWLLSEDPETRAQARLGQFYRLTRALMRNPLAMVGLAIIVALLLVAAFAPWIAPYSPLEGNLQNRL